MSVGISIHSLINRLQFYSSGYTCSDCFSQFWETATPLTWSPFQRALHGLSKFHCWCWLQHLHSRMETGRPRGSFYSSDFFNFALFPPEEALAVSAFFAVSAGSFFSLRLVERTRSSRPSWIIFASHDFISFSYRTLSSWASCKYGWEKIRHQEVTEGAFSGKLPRHKGDLEQHLCGEQPRHLL